MSLPEKNGIRLLLLPKKPFTRLKYSKLQLTMFGSLVLCGISTNLLPYSDYFVEFLVHIVRWLSSAVIHWGLISLISVFVNKFYNKMLYSISYTKLHFRKTVLHYFKYFLTIISLSLVLNVETFENIIIQICNFRLYDLNAVWISISCLVFDQPLTKMLKKKSMWNHEV